MATQKISEMTEAIILQDEDYVPIVQANLNKKIKAEFLRDYNKLHNKPTLNGVVIEGNKLLQDYKIVVEEQGVKINTNTSTLELSVPTDQELEQRAEVNKAITIATADKMAKETAHQTMSKEYQPNDQTYLSEGENQPVSYKAVKEYVDAFEAKVDENERDIEAKHTALENKVDENERDIENKYTVLDNKVDENERDIEDKIQNLGAKDAELEETINTNEQDIEQKVSDLKNIVNTNETDIEQKLSSLNTTVQENKEKLDGKIEIIEEDIVNLENKDLEIIDNIYAGGRLSTGNEFHGTASDYGIEVEEIVGAYTQVTTKGYQLWDGVFEENKSLGSDGNTVAFDGRNVSSYVSVKPNTNYYGFSAYMRCSFYDANKTFISNSDDATLYRTTPENCQFLRFVFKQSDINVQINEGTEALPYEPYTGGEPSPNTSYPQKPQFVQIENFFTSGQNLLNADEYFGAYKNGNVYTATNTQFDTVKIPIPSELIGKTLLFSADLLPSNEISQAGIKVSIDGNAFYSNWATNKINYTNSYIIFTPKTTNDTVKITYGSGNGNISVKNIMLAISNVQIPYTPFVGYTQTPVSLELMALPNGVADTWKDGTLTHNVASVTFDGSEDESWGQYGIQGGRYFGYFISQNNMQVGARQKFLCNKFKVENQNVNDKIWFGVNSNLIYFPYVGTDLSITTVDDWKTYLQSNPITVWYQLATPTTEQLAIPTLQSFYPYTNAWHDSNVKANDLRWFINICARNSEYTDEFLQKFFALQRTGKVYTVKFPLFSKSTSPIGEKMEHNEGLTCEPSTDTIIGQDDYQDIPLFKTYDVNAYVDNNGRIHVTAFKGDKYFKDTGKVDVFVLGMSYYEKYWEDDNYWYYSRTDMPRDGYTLCAECKNIDGSESSYALYSKYVSGEIDGKPYSSKGLIPKRNMGYNVCESYYHSRGKNYGGSPMYLYKYLMTTFYLKYATLNTQSKIYGCFNYSYQYAASMAESDVKRIVLTTAQAANIIVGSYVSIGDKGSNSSVDRGNSYMHNKAEEVEVISKTTVDDSHVAINVDSPTSFNTTTTTYLSTMHWKSGFSDKVLGRDGSIGDLTSGKYPMVLQGIELAVGGYEVAGNAFMDIVSSTGKRDIYVTNDNSKIVTNVTNTKATYNKSKNSSQPTTLNAWNYITKMALDEENGMFNVIECGNNGSGSATGFCDGFYVDSGASGQREFLLLGHLGLTSFCGLSFVNAYDSLSGAHWYFLARLSISGRKG